jgi:fibro-slime domain-containing protein
VTYKVGDLVDLDGDGVADGVAVDANGGGVADGVDTNGDGIADQPLPGSDSGATGTTTGATTGTTTGATTGTATGLGGGVVGGDGGGSCGQTLPVIFRDFKGSNEAGGHADFEISAQYPAASDGGTWQGADQYGNPAGTQPYMGVDESGCNMVAAALSADGKPTFLSGLGEKRKLYPEAYVPNGPARSVTGCEAWTGLPTSWSWTPPPSITSATTFGQWYTTTEGVNVEVPDELALVDGLIDTAEFFPLDNLGFGNTPGQAHNYHFTTEVHVTFTYEAGQTFSFRGDDDLWIFVNGKLALDLGGVHSPMEGTISFDTQAAALGIEVGKVYPMDIFHAERQTVQSNFRVETNIQCFKPPVK